MTVKSDKPITTHDLRDKKQRGERIVMVTAYDATFASILDSAGVDILLVGDSLGMVVQGHTTTLPVTLDHIIYHTSAVARGSKRAMVVADLPFMSYQITPEQGLASAGRLMQEAHAHAIKLEGGDAVAKTCERIVRAGIPVMGHIGLTPQSVHHLGGFRMQGKDAQAAKRLQHEAKALENAGCFSLVLEGMPVEVAEAITHSVSIPTIGIGAGPACDGQVLVCYDLLGMNPNFQPKFLKKYDNLQARIAGAIEAFATDVRSGTFPAEEHSFRARKNLRLVQTDAPEQSPYGGTAHRKA